MPECLHGETHDCVICILNLWAIITAHKLCVFVCVQWHSWYCLLWHAVSITDEYNGLIIACNYI